MRVENICTRQVIGVEPTRSLQDATQTMAENRVGAVIVLERGRMVGILSERDLVRAVADGVEPATTAVQAYMSADPAAAYVDEELAPVARRMAVLGVRHLPVIDDGEVIGMISARDLLAAKGWTPI
jgi:CBS domain-containing protein